jgi:hypothetical protein
MTVREPGTQLEEEPLEERIPGPTNAERSARQARRT